jgi:PPM family protein phosphatase
VQVDIEGPHDVQPGDIYLLCSDGLSNQLTDQEMGAIAQNLPLQDACQFLVDLANLRGGPDNITIVALKIPGEPEADTTKASGVIGKKWWKIVPWPAVAITLGACLAIFSLMLSTDSKSGLQTYGISLFIVSVLCVLAGLVGVFLQRRTEKEEEARAIVSDSLQIYRRHSIQIDNTLINKLMQTETNLLELIREKGWPLEEAKLKSHQQQVAGSIKKNELIAAFKAQCQALALLTSKLRQNRTKDEQFKPNW